MNVSAVLEQLKCLGQLYGSLLDEEKRRLECYLDGDLEQVDMGHLRETHGIEEIRKIHSALSCEFSEAALPQVFEGLPESEREDLERRLADLDGVMSELKAAARRNRRYIQNSLAYSQALAQTMFEGAPSYGGDGIVRAEGRCLSKGMRV